MVDGYSPSLKIGFVAPTYSERFEDKFKANLEGFRDLKAAATPILRTEHPIAFNIL